MIIRDPATFGGARVPHKKRPACEKESQRWVEGYLKTSAVAALLPDCEVISVSDREGDIFEVTANRLTGETTRLLHDLNRRVDKLGGGGQAAFG